MNQTIKTIKESEDTTNLMLTICNGIEYGLNDGDMDFLDEKIKSHIRQSQLSLIDSLIEELTKRKRGYPGDQYFYGRESLNDFISYLKEVKEYLESNNK